MSQTRVHVMADSPYAKSRLPVRGGGARGGGGGGGGGAPPRHREDSLTPTLSRGEREHAQGGVKSLLILVGPEGGFTSEEVGQLAGSGAAVARLTRDILRVETAGVVASSVAMVLFGDAQAPGCDT